MVHVPLIAVCCTHETFQSAQFVVHIVLQLNVWCTLNAVEHVVYVMLLLDNFYMFRLEPSHSQCRSWCAS
jgi:hypothetical protein